LPVSILLFSSLYAPYISLGIPYCSLYCTLSIALEYMYVRRRAYTFEPSHLVPDRPLKWMPIIGAGSIQGRI
jgi:hypothetical protein